MKVKYKPPLYDTVKVKHGKEPLRVVTNLRRPWSWVSGGGRGGGGRLQGEILLSSAEALAEYLNKNSNNQKIASGAHRDLGECGSNVCTGTQASALLSDLPNIRKIKRYFYVIVEAHDFDKNL